MAFTLTSDQITRLQMYLDIGAQQNIFTTAELNILYNDANGVFIKTIVLALRVLMISSSKFADYTEGQTQEARGDRFKQLQAALTYYEEKVLLGQDQYSMVHIRSVPTIPRDRPLERIPFGYPRNSRGWGGGGWW